MHKLVALLAVFCSNLCGVAVQAQTLSANPTTNNGSGGIFLNLTPANTSLQIDSFQTFFQSTSGTPVSIEVWTRPGNYTGFTAANSGWTLTQTATATSAGTTTAATINLTTPIALPFGDSTSVYLHSITAGGGIRYFGTGTTSTTSFSNADLSLLSDTSRTGAVAFGGGQFSPRAFAGTIIYSNPIPEPSLLAAVGLVIGLRFRHRLRG